jgi:hypothetical protein
MVRALTSPWVPTNKLPKFSANNLPTGAVVVAAAVIVLLLIVFSTYFTIDQGERGVILHNGAIVGEAEPGLHFKMPIITSIEKISVQIQKESFAKTAEAYARMQAYSCYPGRQSSFVLLTSACSSWVQKHFDILNG